MNAPTSPQLFIGKVSALQAYRKALENTLTRILKSYPSSLVLSIFGSAHLGELSDATSRFFAFRVGIVAFCQRHDVDLGKSILASMYGELRDSKAIQDFRSGMKMPDTVEGKLRVYDYLEEELRSIQSLGLALARVALPPVVPKALQRQSYEADLSERALISLNSA